MKPLAAAFAPLVLSAFSSVVSNAFHVPPRSGKSVVIATTNPTVRQHDRTTAVWMSLFDDKDENGDTNEPPPLRKFTGSNYMKDPLSSSNSNSNRNNNYNNNNDGRVSARDRIRQREFDLVSRATSPAAFLGQAALILVLLLGVVYVGSTGQLGVNNDYYDFDEDGYFGGDDTVQTPPPVEMLIPNNEKSTSVWL